ncbi:MAG: hypothetical protein H0X26_01125 [Alphaproteobacteria bacterium]|nr:hypothetical protein [Alphaproteobacteria bacterium]
MKNACNSAHEVLLLRTERSNPESRKIRVDCCAPLAMTTVCRYGLLSNHLHSIGLILLTSMLLFSLSIPPLWAHPSLFFTEKDVSLINQSFFLKRQVIKTDKEKENLYLSALVYVNETHWTLWLNNRMIHSTDPHTIQGFHIEKVTPLEAVFSWHSPQSKAPLRFALRSHEMFLGNEKKVIQIWKN